MSIQDKPTLIPWKKEFGPVDPHGVFVTPPQIIYRYLAMKRVDDLVSQQHLFFAKPDSFNDPFDMNENLLDYRLTKQQIKTYVDQRFRHESAEKRKKIYNIYFSQPGKVYDLGLQEWRKARDIVGVCCFSESPLVTLMWSHYSDSHRGVCIGFNFEPFVIGDPTKVLIQPINYMKEIIPMRVGELGGKAVGHWLFTKSYIWEYEKEVRATFHKRNGLVNFDKKCLKEIYFGCRVTDEEIARVNNLLIINGFHEVKYYKMKIDSSIFDVRPVELKFIGEISL